MLRNEKGEVLVNFSENAAIKDSKEPVVLAILESFRFFLSSFHYKLIVRSNSSNAISWILSSMSMEAPFPFLANQVSVFLLPNG